MQRCLKPLFCNCAIFLFPEWHHWFLYSVCFYFWGWWSWFYRYTKFVQQWNDVRNSLENFIMQSLFSSSHLRSGDCKKYLQIAHVKTLYWPKFSGRHYPRSFFLLETSKYPQDSLEWHCNIFSNAVVIGIRWSTQISEIILPIYARIRRALPQILATAIRWNFWFLVEELKNRLQDIHQQAVVIQQSFFFNFSSRPGMESSILTHTVAPVSTALHETSCIG